MPLGPPTTEACVHAWATSVQARAAASTPLGLATVSTGAERERKRDGAEMEWLLGTEIGTKRRMPH